MKRPRCENWSGRQWTPPCPTRTDRQKWRQCANPTSTGQRKWSSRTSPPGGAGVLPRGRRGRRRASAHLPGVTACRRPARCRGPGWRLMRNYSLRKRGAADAGLRPATSSSLCHARAKEHPPRPSSADVVLRPAPSQHIDAPRLRFLRTKKTRTAATARVWQQLSRRRPTLPGGCPPSTIGVGGLNFRVRDGNGCGPTTMVTGNLALFVLTAIAAVFP